MILIFIMIGMQHRIMIVIVPELFSLFCICILTFDSLRIEYHLLSVVILVKMFANVFSYNQITTSSGKEFPKTSIDTATAPEEFDSSVMLTRPNVTFAGVRSGIVYSLPFVVVFAYILVFFRTSTVNGESIFDNKHHIRYNCTSSSGFGKVEIQISISRDVHQRNTV